MVDSHSHMLYSDPLLRSILSCYAKLGSEVFRDSIIRSCVLVAGACASTMGKSSSLHDHKAILYERFVLNVNHRLQKAVYYLSLSTDRREAASGGQTRRLANLLQDRPYKARLPLSIDPPTRLIIHLTRQLPVFGAFSANAQKRLLALLRLSVCMLSAFRMTRLLSHIMHPKGFTLFFGIFSYHGRIQSGLRGWLPGRSGVPAT